MDSIIQQIIKRQNEELIKQIAKDYNLDEKKLLNKFHSASYYGLTIDQTKKYKIVKK